MSLYGTTLIDVIGKALTDKFNLPIPIDNTSGLTLNDIVDLGNGTVTAVLEGKHNSGYRGYTPLSWNKADIGILFNGISVKLKAFDATVASDLINAINVRLGLPLKAEDIIDYTVEPVKAGWDYPTCIIELVPTHPWLKGNIIVSLTDNVPDLTYALITNDVPITFNYPTTATNLASVTYGYDYTAVASTLKDLPLGVLSDNNAKALAEALAGEDGRGWTVSNTSVPLNLYLATVVSRLKVDLATELVPGPNPNYTYVMLVKPDPTYYPGITGITNEFSFYIHYDDITEA